MTVTPSNIPSIDNSPRPEIIADVEQTLKGGFRFLQFPARLEETFLDYFYDRTIKRLRVALLTGIILYALFGLDDLLLLPGFIEKTLFIRFAIVCPVGFAVFALTFSPHFKRLMQPAVWLAMQVGGLGIIAIVALDPQQVGRYHNTGLILVVMYTLALVGMRFWYGVTWAITFLCAYLIMAIPGPLPPPLLVHDIFNIVAAINIGAISNYMMERYVRKDFLQTILVEAEKVQLQETGIKLGSSPSAMS